jgi:hypothetical protein
MRHRHATMFAITVTSAAMLAFGATRTVRAFDDDDQNGLRAIPAIFVGAAGDCGNGYPAGSRIVTAAWLGGMGLPDNGGNNTTRLDLATNPNKNDPHRGLLLSKNGPTPDCSAAGATIEGVRGMLVTPTFELGFDFRNGGHCGAGAPRYNVVAKPVVGPDINFVGGCSNGIRTPAPQDPLEWTRVRFTNAQAFPPLLVGSRIVSIELIFDEGTDEPLVLDDPNGVGLAVVDNLNINGVFIRSGAGIADGTDRGGDHDDDKDKGDKKDDRDGDR